MQKSLWKAAEINTEKVETLQRQYGFPRAIATVLTVRNWSRKDIDLFLQPMLGILGDPFHIPGIEQASEAVWKAIREKVPIAIHGDYDTDGITASALLSWVLRDNGGNVACFLPDRFDDGYGFTPESLKKTLAKNNAGLIITVDCGINSIEAATLARELGIRLIITDHHQPSAEIPEALALINPKLNDENPSLHALAGVGVAFKFAHGFIKYGREHGLGGEQTDLKQVLDLVALGTVADIVPLRGENRILVHHGMKKLQRQQRPGIRALCESAGINRELRPSHIAFQLAPRLNAAGRLGNPEIAMALLSSENIVEAHEIAGQLDAFNRQRQNREAEIFAAAEKQLLELGGTEHRCSLLVADQNWHRGVIGIVASKLARTYHRPTIVISIEDDEAIGSGRSIENINLIDVLSDCNEVLQRFGGHPMAAGLALNPNAIDEFRSRFEEAVCKRINKSQLTPCLTYDTDLELHEINDEFFAGLKKLEPFGEDNRSPIFRINALHPQNLVPAKEKHSRGILRNRLSQTIPFIAFNRAVNTMPSASNWDIIAIPQLNQFRGQSTPQVQIIDVKASESTG